MPQLVDELYIPFEFSCQTSREYVKNFVIETCSERTGDQAVETTFSFIRISRFVAEIQGLEVSIVLNAEIMNGGAI